jgi:hypothetical protein
MSDLFEIIEDLQTLETLTDTPGFDTAFDTIMDKWLAAKAKVETEMERQYQLEFA